MASRQQVGSVSGHIVGDHPSPFGKKIAGPRGFGQMHTDEVQICAACSPQENSSAVMQCPASSLFVSVKENYFYTLSVQNRRLSQAHLCSALLQH